MNATYSTGDPQVSMSSEDFKVKEETKTAPSNNAGFSQMQTESVE